MIDGPYSHVGVVVPDLGRAMAGLSMALGITWAPVRIVVAGPVSTRLTCSQQGPPYMELIEGAAGSPWDAARPGVHHIGYWSDDLEQDRDHLVGGGMRIRFDGTRFGRKFMYLDTEHGLVVEITHSSRRPATLRWIAGEDPEVEAS